MRKLFWLLPVLMGFLLTGCLKDNPEGNTIVLLGTESDFKPIDSVLPAPLLVFINNADSMGNDNVINLPQGNNPPDIQGEFVFEPMELYAGNVHPAALNNGSICIRFGGEPILLIDTVDVTYYPGDTFIQITDTLIIVTDTVTQVTDTVTQVTNTIVVSDTTVVQEVNTIVYYPEGQHNTLVPCDIYGDVMEKGDKYNKKTTNAFVVGTGKKFTAYFTVEYNCEQAATEFKLTRGYILTGEIAKEGIKEAKLAIVNKTVDSGGSSQFASLPREGGIFVYRVKTDKPDHPFGTAKRQDWYQLIP